MRKFVLLLAVVCLVANLAPSVAYLLGRVDLPTAKTALLWTSAAWFIVGGLLVYGSKEPALDSPVVP